MKKKVLVLVLGVLLVSILAACQGSNQVTSNPRLIAVNGVGKVYLVPDIAYVYIGVHSQADNVAAALSQNNTQAQAITSTLKELNIASEDIQTTAFNVYPQQTYGPNGEVTGTIYVVENQVYVKVRDLQNLGSMLDAVVRSGANNITGITFDVQDHASAEAEARKLAIEDAKSKATELANLAGVQLGELYGVNISSSGSPMPVYEAKGGVGGGAATVPVAAGQLMIEVDANLSYLIK